MKTKYKQTLDDFMEEVTRNSSEWSNYDFDNAGWNLIIVLRADIEPEDLVRDYQTEYTELIDTYKKLFERIDEIKKTTSENILTLSQNSFLLSIDIFIKNILKSTFLDEMVPNVEVIDVNELPGSVAICHDCIIKIYNLINNDTFILGSNDNYLDGAFI